METKYIDGVATEVHPDDEMYLFFTSHPLLKDDPLRHYFISGQQMLNDLEAILRQCSVELKNVDSFLEFACGYGRFTRHLLKVISPSKVTVSDVYRNAVDFQKKTFQVNGFYSDFNPDLPVFPRKYDVIFVASLFSHLPMSTWVHWLEKLYSNLNADGLLIFTTHGPSCMSSSIVMPSSGFYYLNQSESKSHSFENYGTTYVTEDFVRDVVTNKLYSDLVFFKQKGMWNYQDVYVVKRT